MTEAEWLCCTEPERMLSQLRQVSERKLRLFAVACCRRVLRHMGNQRSREAVEIAERFADGLASRAELLQAYEASRRAAFLGDARSGPRWAAHHATAGSASVAALVVPRNLRIHPVKDLAGLANHCELLRDIFGPEPFRPLEVSSDWLAWQGGVILQMAQTIYAEGRFEDLPVLADALEEAGCTDWDILWHCRSGGEHVRGCWVVDLLLAKE